MNQQNNRFGLTLLTLIPVCVMWVIIFAWQPLNFWLLMTAAQITMITMALGLRGRHILPKAIPLKETAIGLGSALLLYAIFVVAHEISVWLFDFAKGDIQNIYAIRDQAQATWIALLLLFIIGPGEEIYWRGLYLKEYGDNLFVGVLLSTFLFTLWHISLWHIKGLTYQGGLIALVGGAYIMGILWCFISRKVQNISYCLIAHVFVNIFVFTGLFVQNSIRI